jgi:hypothetical protein
LQPFEYCVHLEQDEVKPYFDVDELKPLASSVDQRPRTLWRSFCANWATNRRLAESTNYNVHGHVGFAWGARRQLLKLVPLYDRALIGGADHIIAHAAAGQIPSECIRKAFRDDIEEVEQWSRRFFGVVSGQIGFVPGNLYHLWHGDIDRRQYLKRIQDFTLPAREIKEKDARGLYVNRGSSRKYVTSYFRQREVAPAHDDSFLQSMAIGYMTDSAMMGTLIGGNPIGAIVGSSLADHHHHEEGQSLSTNNAPAATAATWDPVPASVPATPAIEDRPDPAANTQSDTNIEDRPHLAPAEPAESENFS